MPITKNAAMPIFVTTTQTAYSVGQPGAKGSGLSRLPTPTTTLNAFPPSLPLYHIGQHADGLPCLSAGVARHCGATKATASKIESSFSIYQLRSQGLPPRQWANLVNEYIHSLQLALSWLNFGPKCLRICHVSHHGSTSTA